MDPLKPMIPADAAFYRGILERISDGVYFVDLNRRILFWSEGAHRLSGYTSEDVVGHYCQDDILCHVDYSGTRLCRDGCPLLACMRDGSAREARVFLHNKHGRRVPVLVKVQPLRGDDGQIVGAVEIFSDDTAQAETLRRTEEMRKMALLDHLTQLPNRRYLELSLQSAMGEFHALGMPFGILVLDLDRFKEVNDQYGHAAGDRVLQETARTIAASLRPTDVVARWGGDEFVALIHHASLDLLEMLAKRCAVMVSEMAVPVQGGAQVRPSASVGIALIRPGESGEELLHRGDRMMYRSKQRQEGRSLRRSRMRWLVDLLQMAGMSRILARFGVDSE